ncbi:MAG: amidophosphoribosyltransferase [Candidatus Omnitrophica bacterium]|nr:amidophosphoribosyltransferase [Candidatus Omnitrophota bacterium]
MSDDGIKEHCGLFGVFNHPEAARLTHLGLYALQHRGEESAGMVVSDSQTLRGFKGMGLVEHVFTGATLAELRGTSAIGHTRYSTTGSSQLKNAQPLQVDYSRGSLAIAHNGNLINAWLLRDELEAHGSIFQTTVDSEVILHLMARPTFRRFEDALVDSLLRIAGAFSLVILREDELIGVRDPSGFRPLCLGRLGDATVLASETCALDLIGATLERELAPGEVVVINRRGVKSLTPFPPKTPSSCIFEHVYFARPDSQIFGESVHLVRQRLGRQLAKEHPVAADIVIAIPDSGNSAALGYSHESGIPLEIGMARNHYAGRTFIQPLQESRDFRVRVKFNPVREVLKGRRVVVVDDSIVRGTTCRARLQSIREAGATEIHMRVSCPPIKHPCFYGIDFPTKGELIACTHSIEEIRKFLGVDSLGYLSLEGMLGAVSGPKDQYCTACYSGRYPLPFGGEADKYILERKTTGELKT